MKTGNMTIHLQGHGRLVAKSRIEVEGERLPAINN